MTTDELRDWHAREAGWENHPDDGWCHPDHEYILDRPHPYQPTIDGAASAMPEGWRWGRGCRTRDHLIGCWYASRSLTCDQMATMRHHEITNALAQVHCLDTGDEIHDRYLLAKLAKEAMKR